MAPPIQLNQFYQVQQAQLKASDLQTGEQSLLTLFSESCFDIQVKNLLELFALSEQKFSFYVEQKSATFYWSVYADYSSLLTLKKQLTESHFDYLLWPEKVVEPPRLLLFDMDSTFIEIEVIDELANYHNVGEEVSRVTEAAMRGELDFSESLISRVACLKGLEQSAIDLIAAKLPLSKGVVELVNYAKKNGCVSAIVSGGFTPFVGKLKVDLDLYKVKANELEANRKGIWKYC